MSSYASNTRTSRTSSGGADLARLSTVSICFAACIAGSMVGVGVFGGTPIAEAAGGALSADATYLAPAGSAFSIWPVVYTGLGLYTVYQWFPSQRRSDRQRSLGWLVAASLVLNAAWILTVQAGAVILSVVVIVLLLAVLALCFRRYATTRASGWLEAIAVDGVLGLYLGWVCVATAANTASALTAEGFRGFGIAPEAWACVVLAVVAGVGAGLAAAGRGRLAPAASLVWGLAWIAVSRLNGGLESVPTAVAAVAAAVVVAAVTVAFRVRAVRSAASVKEAR
ncbi:MULTISPECIES: tryptophan-rich sensory protein [unclassified Arthrobacter]|uniref:tryptophan-rich sensory protein n=1 Tax=unclassified Arthrobacter TaxID=235627 RepID=UPI00210221EB|nr:MULTISPECIES: tryptophan-rich sensory protein [unclassified Arthrobacter]MCQ1947792.1 tryptophan-rich sensory protein [Arthrobacter sp. zg-Y1116]MCQ1996304.1 tryptophan-rich sensory protein [Arthrobacter sp. zg-Y1171]UWX82649.1 tryptophan-rich sensory protein [Arthrobacter sp. zg-Y1171]